MSPRETEDQLLYSLSNGLWDIARLREVLERILPDHKVVQDFEIEQDFPGMGHRVLALTVRRLDGFRQILLGIEDVTERREEPVDRREYPRNYSPPADWSQPLIDRFSLL